MFSFRILALLQERQRTQNLYVRNLKNRLFFKSRAKLKLSEGYWAGDILTTENMFTSYNPLFYSSATWKKTSSKDHVNTFSTEIICYSVTTYGKQYVFIVNST